IRRACARRRGCLMKRSRACPSLASWSRRCSFSGADSRLPPSTSRSHRPRYSTRSQRSIRLAVASRDSLAAPDTSAHRARLTLTATPIAYRFVRWTLQRLRVVPCLRYDADHLPCRDLRAGRDGELADRPVPVRSDLVLHLHGLDDADHLPGLHLVTLRNLDCQHRALHRAHHRLLRRPMMSTAARSLPTASGEIGVGRLPLEQLDAVAAAVELELEEARAQASVRRLSYVFCLMRHRRTYRRDPLRFHQAVEGVASTKHGWR